MYRMEVFMVDYVGDENFQRHFRVFKHSPHDQRWLPNPAAGDSRSPSVLDTFSSRHVD